MKLPIAVVTGANRGIGRAVAQELAREGYSLGLIARNRTQLDSVRAEIEDIYRSSPNQGGKVVVAPAHVENLDEVRSAVALIQENLGTPTLLFNNAGVNPQGTLDIDPDTMKTMMDINYHGAWNVLSVIAPLMKEAEHGYIFNISSVCGVTAIPSVGAYCASKHALHALSLTLFKELAPYGVHVTAIAPSWVDTDMARHAPILAGEMIRPTDIFEAVRFVTRLSPGAVIPELVIECRSDLL